MTVFVMCPLCGRRAPEYILKVEACAVLDEQADKLHIAVARGLVQGRAVGVAAQWVKPIGVLACVEQGSRYIGVAELRGKREREVPVFRAGGWQQAKELIQLSLGGEDRQIDLGAKTDEGIERSGFAMQGGGVPDAVGVGAICAEQLD